VSLRLNFFTPTKKAVGYASTATGRRKRVYDTPATPWQRLQASDLLDMYNSFRPWPPGSKASTRLT